MLQVGWAPQHGGWDACDVCDGCAPRAARQGAVNLDAAQSRFVERHVSWLAEDARAAYFGRFNERAEVFAAETEVVFAGEVQDLAG